MLDNCKLNLLNLSDINRLEQEKIGAREQFLQLPSEVAQSLLDERINPHQWQPDFSQGFNLNSLSLSLSLSSIDD